MRLLVLPVSGPGFVSQLAILQHLCEIDFVPDITLASSGGNVAAYVASAANWKWSSITRISRSLNKELFVKPWSTIAAVSLIVGYFEGNIHNKGLGVKEFLLEHFTPETIVKNEIWTGTYNKTRQKARLFCNRSKEDSILDIDCIDHELTQSMNPVFANGNIDIIGLGGIASASIPTTVPAQTIFGEQYEDGGVAGASPLTIMREPILKYVSDNNTSLHIIYVNSVNLSCPTKKPCHNVIDNWKQTANNMIRSQTIIDRLAAYDLLRSHPGTLKKDEFLCNYANLLRVKKIHTKVQYSLLEIFPTTSNDLNIVTFTGSDVTDNINKMYGKCMCRLWWLVPDDASMDYESSEKEIIKILEECKK